MNRDDKSARILAKVTALLVCTVLALAGCSSGSNTTLAPSPQPSGTSLSGGSIQNRALSVSGTASPLAGFVVTGQEMFGNASGITTDGSFLYVADTDNNAIRKVNPATGTVTTLAGGAHGMTDGTGSAARFNGPQGLTVVGQYLYVTDSGNGTIRRIDKATGAVTTLAGNAYSGTSVDGVGSAATFTYPTDITTDGTSLYVADDCAVRKIDIATGTVTTPVGRAEVRGSADATGNEIFDAKLTTDGVNLYVVDVENNRIRKVEIASGAVTTLAEGFNRPSGIATDGTNLYVAEMNSACITKIVIATGDVTIVAGSPDAPRGATDGIGTAAKFVYPQAIATDGIRLYVTDQEGYSVRSIAIATGAVTTLAGTGGPVGSADGIGPAARFNWPCGVTTDGTSLYVADLGNNLIRQVSIATGAVSTLAGSAEGPGGSADGIGPAAQFNRPYGITNDGTNLYVVEIGKHAIRKVVIATGAVSTVAGSPLEMGSNDGIGSAARFTFPTGITTDGTNLYVADYGNSTIRKVVLATGEVTTLAGSGAAGYSDGVGAAARFHSPLSLTTDGTSLYVTDVGNACIRKIDIATGTVTTLAGSVGVTGATDGIGSTATFSEPAAITCDGTNLFVADWAGQRIRKIVIATGAVTTLGQPFYNAVFLTNDDGALYATTSNHTIITIR